MRQIWKFKLTDMPLVVSEGSVFVPRGSEFRACQIQQDGLCIWVSTKPSETQKEWWHWRIVGTGEYFDPLNEWYVATVQHGSDVWHLFWRGRS